MQALIQHLQQRLQQTLPHAALANEKLSDTLKHFIKTAQEKALAPNTKKPPRVSAVMIALFRKNDDEMATTNSLETRKKNVYIPFMMRPKTARVHPGQIAFPGGGYEPQDRDFIDTAIRETQEELGIQVAREHVIGQLTPIYIPPSNALVYPIIAYLDPSPIYTPNPAEVAAILEFTLHDLVHPAHQGVKTVQIKPNISIDFPAYLIQDKVIWGGTARILAELILCIQEADIALI